MRNTSLVFFSAAFVAAGPCNFGICVHCFRSAYIDYRLDSSDRTIPTVFLPQFTTVEIFLPLSLVPGGRGFFAVSDVDLRSGQVAVTNRKTDFVMVSHPLARWFSMSIYNQTSNKRKIAGSYVFSRKSSYGFEGQDLNLQPSDYESEKNLAKRQIKELRHTYWCTSVINKVTKKFMLYSCELFFCTPYIV